MKQVIIIGDSSHNTLGAIRSFGEAKIPLLLILVCKEDVCYVQKSKYLNKRNCFLLDDLEKCSTILQKLHSNKTEQYLITTFDSAAEWVDSRERALSKMFVTPCRGKSIGNLFNKYEQCKLAKECGLDVPDTILYTRGDNLDNNIKWPIILKPLVSTEGSKSDIHICYNQKDFVDALSHETTCSHYVLQGYIEKEYEIDAVGISIDGQIIMGGGIRKYRHWPKMIGAGAYGVFDKFEKYGYNYGGLRDFLLRSNYNGPFSIEFIHTKDNRNVFMEINFRNEGLAYVATCAGINLHALYIHPEKRIDWKKFKKTYLMNYSIDFLYVKDGSISLWEWLRDLLRTRCFINFCLSDIAPTLYHYKGKFIRHKNKVAVYS